MLSAASQKLDAVLELTVDVDEVVSRLVKRASEQGRSDDTEDVIRRRLEVYFEQTAPLIDLYRSQGLLVQVDGLGEIGEVTGRVVVALAIEA
jgi:adenylate kinase